MDAPTSAVSPPEAATQHLTNLPQRAPRLPFRAAALVIPRASPVVLLRRSSRRSMSKAARRGRGPGVLKITLQATPLREVLPAAAYDLPGGGVLSRK